ncbi:MAG: type II secretion system F family protein [Caldicoprobacterales bacterium]
MDGQEVQGFVEASDKEEAIAQLRQIQLLPISIKKYRDINISHVFTKITSKDLSIFCKQYASMLKAGVPSVQGLDMIINQTSNPLLKNLLQRVCSLVQEGHYLSQAMLRQEGHFPLILIRTIEAGEWSGTLDTSFDRMAEYFEKQYKIKKKISKALAYPIFLSLTSILIVYFLMRVVVPQFITLFENAQIELPKCTQILLGIKFFFENNSIYLILSLLIIFLLSRLALCYEKSRNFLHSLILNTPYFGSLIKKVVSARFNRTVAMLISSGVSITHTLVISSKVTRNEFISKKLANTINMVQQGQGIAKALDSLSIFSSEIINFIAIGEESGQIEEMMNKVADICEIEAETAIDSFIALLEPLSVLFLGGIIAFIVISVALPMFEMYVFIG